MTHHGATTNGFGDQVEEWTVERLRLALAGVPGQLPIRVLVAQEPGGDVGVQVLYSAGYPPPLGRVGSVSCRQPSPPSLAIK